MSGRMVREVTILSTVQVCVQVVLTELIATDWEVDIGSGSELRRFMAIPNSYESSFIALYNVFGCNL